MAITVVKYPQGHIVDTTAVAATVSSSSGALVTKTTHGLVTGDYIYIISSLSAYNGYWYVNKNDANTFWLREYPTASNVAFVNSGSITYYKSQLTHGWNSVHLPIIYKLKSDSWPINGVDTARTITTFSNWNGYTALILSGDVKSSGDASALESVVLSGTSVDGVYKIIQWSSDTAIVIDLLYSAANVLSSGTCQYYYLNYHAKVKIYAGLTGTHYWTASKPYELMATVKLIPDSTGVMTLNVSEYVMGKLEILKNDLQEDELPNNLDAFCRIYISVAEAYDDSNMYTISEYTSSYSDDTTEIYAVNAKLPFQTRSGSAMDDYIGVTGTYAYPALSTYAQHAIPSSGSYWSSYAPGTGTWTLGATPSLTIATTQSPFLYGSFPSKGLTTYRIYYSIDGGLNGANCYFQFWDSSFVETISSSYFASPPISAIAGVQTGYYDITTDRNGVYFGVFLTGGGVVTTFTINTLSITELSNFGGVTQKFLTPFARPTLFAGHYFDLSYILNSDSTSTVFIKRDLYRKSQGNYSLINSILDPVTDYDQGVYRYPKTQSASLEDRIDFTIVSSPTTINDKSAWTQTAGTGTIAWTLGASPSVALANPQFSYYLYNPNLTPIAGDTYRALFDVTFGGSAASTIRMGFLNASLVLVGTASTSSYTTQTTGIDLSAVAPVGAAYLFIQINRTSGAGSPTQTLARVDAQAISKSETKIVDVVSPADCHDTTGLYLTWLNYLGGYDYWYFSAQKKYSVDVTENKTQTQNIYNQYPKSYSELAQSIDQQSVRKTKNIVKVTSQYLTKAQVDGIAWIVSSPLVQILTDTAYGEITIQQLRTVLVDTSTLAKYQDRDNLYSISFNITYTDELPVQSL